MSYLELKKEEGAGSIPVFQKVLETARGGFTLTRGSLVKGAILKAGTPIAFDEETRRAVVAKKSEAGSDANGLLYDDVVIEDNAPLAVVVRGTVYENRLPTSGNGIADWDDHKEALPLIIFSKSF